MGIEQELGENRETSTDSMNGPARGAAARGRFLVERERLPKFPQTVTGTRHRRALSELGLDYDDGKLRETATGLLAELRDLPSKVTDPNWMDSIEEETYA